MSAQSAAGRSGQEERRTRIAFDLSPQALEDLDELQKIADVSTRAELIRRALKLYGWMVRAEREGNQVLVRSTKDQSETIVKLL